MITNISNGVSIASYVSWESPTMKGARVTIAGTALEDDSAIAIASAAIADVHRKPSGDVDLLIVCIGDDDPAAKKREISEQLVAAASNKFDAASWLTELATQGGWYAAMADGRVGLGFSCTNCTDAQMSEARRMIAALSSDQRDAVENEVRVRATSGVN